MIYCLIFNLAVLAISLGLSIFALFRGPGALNRTVALDMITAVTIGGLCLITVWQTRTDTIPILIALTLISFLTATSVARIVGQRAAVVSRGPSLEELEQMVDTLERDQQHRYQNIHYLQESGGHLPKSTLSTPTPSESTTPAKEGGESV